MAYKVYLKDNIGNELAGYIEDLPKAFITSTLQITDGLLKKGIYQIPVEHILFIEEV